MANKYKAQSREAQAENKKIYGCSRKKAFETKEEAIWKGQAIYQCLHCDKWHRTKSVQDFVNKLRRKK